MNKKDIFIKNVKNTLLGVKKKVIKTDKKIFKIKNKIEKKIEGAKYIGRPAKHIFNIGRRFDKSFPRVGKAMDYAVLIPEPGSMSVSVGAKALGGGSLMLGDYLRKKKKK